MIGFKYNGTHSDTLNLIMTGKKVPVVPPLRENFEEIPGKDGSWDFGVQYGARTFEIDCTIIASSPTDLKSKLRYLGGFFNPKKGAKALIFDDEPDKQYYARLTGQLPLDQVGALGSFTLQFICTDPFLYNITPTTVSGSGSLNCINNGTYDAQPTITITHGGGAGTLVNTRVDAVVETLTFTSGSPAGTYVVNCKEGTITKSGAGAYQYLSGDFFKFPSGTNVVTKTGSVTSSSIVFSDTYL